MESAQMKVAYKGSDCIVTLSGFINEYAKFREDLKLGGRLVIDFKNDAFISSVGISKWIKWIKIVQEQDPKTLFVFRRVSSSIIRPMNEILGFLPENYRIESFALPYYCERCDRNVESLLERDQDFDKEGNLKEPLTPVQCPSCNNMMEKDVVMSRYFVFLQSQTK